jgi:sugar-specific transcriptional regulator TrmB/DNA-binding CsgD family transcriptional regulator
MLQPLGISADAEAVYVGLAPMASGTVPEIARLTTTDPASTERALQELRGLGLAAELSPGLWQALPLLEVANALRAQRLSELEMATVAAESLHSHLLAATQNAPDNDIQIVVGREGILAARREICNSAKNEICAFDKPPYVQPRPNATAQALDEISPEWQALERGARLRCVYHPGFDSDRLAELALFAERGEQSRTAPVPMKLILVDAQVALIPSMRSYSPGHELRASITRHPMLVEALQWLFETVWEASVPIVNSAFSENDPRRQMLISLLMTGSTDGAIATQLGINVRSVRRWISELMDELGVTTRLQLGAALVRADTLRDMTLKGLAHQGESAVGEASPAPRASRTSRAS